MATVFLDTLDNFCQKYLSNDGRHLTEHDMLMQKFNNHIADSHLFENLMLYDKVNLMVKGANLPLIYIINKIGMKGLENLLDQNSLSFTLWNASIMWLKDDTPGAFPLIAGHFNSTLYNDPEESILTGINILSNQLNTQQRKTLVNKVRDLYIFPDTKLIDRSKDLALASFKNNRFNVLGFNTYNLDILRMDKYQKEKLQKCVTTILEYNFLISKNFSTYSKTKFKNLYEESFEKVPKNTLNEYFSTISRVENFPDLSEFSKQIENPLSNVIHLRNKKNIKKFRKWLNNSVSNVEIEEISKLYIEDIKNAKGFFESKYGKLTKSVFMWSVGAGAGSFIGPEGAFIGGALGGLMSPVVDVGLDMIDEYFLTELTKGWTPQLFFDELRSLKNC